MSASQEGILIKSTGSWYEVRLPDGRVLPCRIKGKFRLGALKLTNPVAVGDVVRVEESEQDVGTITAIAPRRNYVVRQSTHRRTFSHLLACNIDQALLISTIVQPMLKQGFIDRFLLMTEPHDIPVIVAFNKADVYEAGDLGVFGHLREVYERIGYQVLLLSAHTGQGLDELAEALRGRTTLVSGHSGVGKSSILNALQPQLGIRTQDLSDYSGKGQHTTTFAEMYPLDFGGQIIDTPGIKSLSFINMTPQEVAHNFREFFALAEGCRYANCMHLNEPGCAVKAALEDGRASELRYANYVQILEDIGQQNDWERNKQL